MAEAVWEEWIRNDVLATFCPGYSPDDPTVVSDDKSAPAAESGGSMQPRLARIQAGKLPNGEEGRLELVVTDGRHDCSMIPSEPALKAYFHENADQRITKNSFVGDRRTGEGTEGAPMVGEVVRLDDYRLLLESGPNPVYAVRRMTYMEGMADELGGDEEEEEEEEEDEDGNKKEKVPKPEDPLLTSEEAERVLTLKRRAVRGDAADRSPVLTWNKTQTTQSNPQASEKKTNPKAGTLLSMASCLHGKYACVTVGPRVLAFFDKPSKVNSVQERVVTVLDTERAHFTRHVLTDARIPAECEADTGFGMPSAVCVDGKVYVLGGSPVEQQQVLRMDPVSMETWCLSYEGDEHFPACDFGEAIVVPVGPRILVLAADLTGGWGTVRALDTTQISLLIGEPSDTEQDEYGKWESIATEAEVPGPCEPGQRRGVVLGHELWVFTSTPGGLEVHVLDTEQMYWHKAPVTGSVPPALCHFEVAAVGRSVHIIAGRLGADPTPAFRGTGLQYESGCDYLYSLDTDRCEWTQRHCHGQIPAYASRGSIAATESDLWLLHPTIDANTWWHAGTPQMPEGFPEEKAVKSTKFGAVQFTYMLPKVVYPVQDVADLRERTWVPPPAPTKWKELDDREYLNQTVWTVLQRGMAVLEKERPNRPVRALAEFLLMHDKGAPK